MATPSRLDGCAEFDERLIETAFAPGPDAALDAHLASCGRCRAARDRYLETADAIGGALALADSSPRPRPRRARRFAGVAAAVVLLGAGALVAWRLDRSGVDVVTGAGARIEREAPGAWSITDGVATFETSGARLTVSTPIGVVVVDEGRFTVSVERVRKRESSRSGLAAGTAVATVTVAVAIGVVTWLTGDDEPVVVRSGETAVRSEPDGAAADSMALERALAPRPPAPAVETTPPSAAVEAPAVAAIGRVVDAESREPVAGARVAVLAHAAWSAPVLCETTSAPDGAFRLHGFTSGYEAIRVESPDHAPFIGGFLFDADAVRAAAGAVARGEAPPPFDLGDLPLPRGARVEGLVRQGDGTPVAGAAILSFDGRSMGGVVLVDAREVGLSGEDGRFSLERVGPSSFGSPFLAAVGPEGIGWSSIAVLPGRDAIDGVEIVIEESAEAVVTVSDSAERPVEGAVVAARPMFRPFGADYGAPDAALVWLSPRADVRAIFVATTDAEGRAVLPRLPVAERGEYGFHAIRGERTCGGSIHALAAGQRTEVRLRLAETGTIAVSGRVTSAATGEPIAGARVWSFEGDAGESDAEGRYVIERMVRPAGAALPRLNAAADGHAATMRSIDRPPGDADRLDDVDFALERTARVSGRVVDEPGDPVVGAHVNLHRRGHAPLGAATDGEGRFAFADATESEWGLRVQPPEPFDEWRSLERPLVVRGGGPEAVVTLERRAPGRARLVAEIVDAASGAPVDPKSASVVAVSTPHEGPHWVTTTREAGLVEAERLRAGTWRLVVAATGGRMAWRDFTVEETTEEVRLRVEIEAPGSIAGRVSGEGAKDARVTATLRGALVDVGAAGGDDVRAVASAVVGADGSFRIPNLVPGSYLVALDGSGVAGGTEAVVATGDETIVSIAAERSGRVAFRTPPLPADTWIYLVVTRKDGGAVPVVANLGVDPGGALTHSIDARPGTFAWKVRFELADHTARDAAAPQEGEVEVRPGETTEVMLPIVPPKGN